MSQCHMITLHLIKQLSQLMPIIFNSLILPCILKNRNNNFSMSHLFRDGLYSVYWHCYNNLTKYNFLETSGWRHIPAGPGKQCLPSSVVGLRLRHILILNTPNDLLLP